jgi:hypothetical protein
MSSFNSLSPATDKPALYQAVMLLRALVMNYRYLPRGVVFEFYTTKVHH